MALKGESVAPRHPGRVDLENTAMLAPTTRTSSPADPGGRRYSRLDKGGSCESRKGPPRMAQAIAGCHGSGSAVTTRSWRCNEATEKGREERVRPHAFALASPRAARHHRRLVHRIVRMLALHRLSRDLSLLETKRHVQRTPR